MKNKTINPLIDLANTLKLYQIREVEDFCQEYFKVPLDVKSYGNGLIEMSEYLQQTIDFWEGIEFNEWGLYCLNTHTDITGDFWYDSCDQIGESIHAYLLSGSNVSFLTYYKEEIDKIEDDRIFTIIYHLMEDLVHTPETLSLLSKDIRLFKLLAPRLSRFELIIILNMNEQSFTNGEIVDNYITDLKG